MSCSGQSMYSCSLQRFLWFALFYFHYSSLHCCTVILFICYHSLFHSTAFLIINCTLNLTHFLILSILYRYLFRLCFTFNFMFVIHRVLQTALSLQPHNMLQPLLLLIHFQLLVLELDFPCTMPSLYLHNMAC